jgi:hypothetical protein
VNFRRSPIRHATRDHAWECATRAAPISPTTHPGRCDPCRREYRRERDQVRGNSTERGYGADWPKLGAGVFARKGDLSLVPCPATTVNHVVHKVHRGTDAMATWCRPAAGATRAVTETLDATSQHRLDTNGSHLGQHAPQRST